MSEADDLHARALACLNRGDTAGGITDLKAYLALEPEDSAAWLELGTAYAVIDHVVQAADAMREAVDLDGEDVDARLAYARVLEKLSKRDEAAFQLLQANKVDASDARVLKELGLVFYDKHLYEKAAAWLEKAIAVSPDDARVHYALGLAHEGRRDMAAAVLAYRDAIRCDARFIDARRTLADALATLGEHEAAIAELDGVLALDRTNEQAARNREVLARALEKMREGRLLGRGQHELEASALVAEGQMKKREPVREGGGLTLKYSAPMVELYAALDHEHRIVALQLVLTSPERAAEREDDVYKVTVLGADGTKKPMNFATAVTLTFLREALGCPMTKASDLYAHALEGKAVVDAGATIDVAPDPTGARHGLRVRIT